MGLPNVITFLARELVLRDVKANPAVVSVTPYQVRIKKLKKKKANTQVSLSHIITVLCSTKIIS